MPRGVVSTAKRRKIPFTFVPIPRTFLGWLPHLSDSEVRVYLAIAAHTLDRNTFSAPVPMTVLHEYSKGLHRSTLYRAIKSLESRGLLAVTRATKHVSRYEIKAPPYVASAQHTDEKTGCTSATPEAA